MGKQAGASPDADWGTLKILIYPAGTEIPRSKQTQAAVSSKTLPD